MKKIHVCCWYGLAALLITSGAHASPITWTLQDVYLDYDPGLPVAGPDRTRKTICMTSAAAGTRATPVAPWISVPSSNT